MFKGLVRLFMTPVGQYNDFNKRKLINHVLKNIYLVKQINTKKDIYKLYYRILLQYQKNMEIYNIELKYSLDGLHNFFKSNKHLPDFFRYEYM